MRTLLTGGSGFLGSYLQKHLKGEVITLGRSKSNMIQCSLGKEIPRLSEVDLVVHNAGLAHRVPKSPIEEEMFFETNFTGTKNLLKGIDQLSNKPKAFVFVSTVAVYGFEKGELISEEQAPKPLSPYGKSKWEAEKVLHKWAMENKVNLTILRLPLVAGGDNTPGNLGAMMKAIKKGYYRRIGKAEARKSIVLAEDVARLIPSLVTHSGTYNLTDGANPSMKELEDYLAKFYGRKIRSISSGLVALAAWIGDHIKGFPINSYRLAKLGESLTFDDSKARSEIGWNPNPVIGNLDLKN